MVAFKDSPDSQIPTHGTRALICHSNQQSPTGLLTNGLRCQTKDSGFLNQRWIDTGPLNQPQTWLVQHIIDGTNAYTSFPER